MSNKNPRASCVQCTLNQICSITCPRERRSQRLKRRGRAGSVRCRKEAGLNQHRNEVDGTGHVVHLATAGLSLEAITHLEPKREESAARAK